MNESEQLLSHFSKTELVSLPVLRLALRACLLSDFTLGQTVKEKNRIFCLITRGIFWPKVLLKDIWAEIRSRSVAGNLPKKRDLPTLLNFCAFGNAAAQNACRDVATTHLQRRPDILRRVLEVSLVALELDELATKGQPENLEFARTLYSLQPLEVRILEIAALSNTRIDFNFFLTHFPILGKLDQLAPGDFATIRRQESVLNERFDVSTWISELEREHAMREPHSKQRVGFI